MPDTSSPPSCGAGRPGGAGTAGAGPAQAAAPDSKPPAWRPSAPSAQWTGLAWLLLVWLLCLVVFVVFARREALLFYAVWLGFALVWGFRVSGVKPTLWVVSTMIGTAVAAVGIDAAQRDNPAEELAAVALMAVVFLAVVWQVHRRQSATAEQARLSEEKGRLLATQRRFLQDASHQLRTPITIALGHAELLARELAGRGEQQDVHAVVGELTRLKRLSERLLLIASSEDPEFLRPEPVALDSFIMELLGRWMPTAQRHWRLGQIDQVTVHADRERLGLALDALVENAVRHTGPEDSITLSVRRDRAAGSACIAVEDTGEGIPADELATIFERFRSGSGDSGSRSTGLGLTLVQAIAHGHGGDVRVHATPGVGSKFELMLPVMPATAEVISMDPSTMDPSTIDPGIMDPGIMDPGITVKPR